MRRGFTLLEILLVVAIVALLAALLFPVLSMAKKSSKRAVCTEQLRQLGQALSLYDPEGDRLPPNLDVLASTGLLTSKELLLCPDDPVGGYASKFDACRKLPHTFAQTYETMFSWPEGMIQRLEKTDANHGLVVCRVHGQHGANYELGLKRFCDYAWHMFQGTLLRLRKDGSVQSAKYRLHRKVVNGAVVEEAAMVWELFTDLPDPSGIGKGHGG